jgi:hypothetical protein
MNETPTANPAVGKIQMIGVVLAVIGLVGLGLGFATAPQHFWQSYLIGFVMWNGVTLGCLGLLMLHHMVGGEWGFVNRRFLEAGAMCSIVMAVLAVPLVLFGSHTLYDWTDPAKVAGDLILREKAPYLNLSFFYVRVAIYFVFWIGTAVLLNTWSADVDKTGSPSFRTKARLLSGPGILVYTLLYTLYMVDFMMSLEPHWTSTIFGLMQMVGSGLAALSLMAILMWTVRDTEPFVRVINRARFWDIGNLMLAFTSLWAYMAFSQYLISWAGNTPEESDFYHHRTAATSPYKYVAIGLVVLHFVVPFFLLLQRSAKQTGGALAAIGLLLIVMRFVDIFWIVKPSFDGEPAQGFYWSDPFGPLAFCGVWIVAFTVFLRTKLLLPVYETHHDRPPVKSEVYTHA